MTLRAFVSILAVVFTTAACVPDLRISDARAGDASDIAADGVSSIDALGDALPDRVAPADGSTCASGQSLCDGTCIDTSADIANCGGCGVTCPAGPNATATCGAGVCGIRCDMGFGDCDHNAASGCEVDLATDETHCGTCPTECVGATNASPVCTAGSCGIVCRPGYGDCDGISTNGCEARLDVATTCGTCGNTCSGTTPLCVSNAGVASCVASCAAGAMLCGTSCATLATDPNHCGSCTTACAAPTNGRATCTAGACGVACDTGFHLCGAMCVPSNSVGTCGTSCSACPARANAAPTCSAGACGFTCNAGYADCDRDPANGCEVNLQTNADNCGACTTVCAFPHAGRACSGGQCTLGACGANYANCDGTASNGCEVAITTAANCGSCGNACAAGATCTSGACVMTTCTAGTANCDGSGANGCEVNTATDPANCGSCANACSFAHAAATCASGACVRGACAAGYADCDANASNGCERATASDPNNCGSCARVCTFTGASATCSAGACVLGACNAGRANCDGTAANGCEVAISSDPANCGTCGTVCSLPHATASCAAGACAIGSCAAGWGDCNGMVADGCETALNTNTNCGTCGTACSATSTQFGNCSSGTCVHTCMFNRDDCNGLPADGCETLINTSSHCGSCTRSCGGTTPRCCYDGPGAGTCIRTTDTCFL